MRITIFFLLLIPFVASGQGGILAQNEDTSRGPVYISVDSMPEFPGGNNAMFSYVAKHAQYPAACRDSGIAGTVYVQFVVDTGGHAWKVKALRKVHPLLDAEAVRVVSEMPAWEPGRLNGKRVNVHFTIPVKFALSDAARGADAASEKIYLPDELTVKQQFPGGSDSLYRYFTKNKKYPQACKDSNITGIVQVQFVINTLGRNVNIQVTQSAHPLLDAEAVRLIRDMPAWIPGQINGTPVNVRINVPVHFTLNNPKRKIDETKVTLYAYTDSSVVTKPRFPGGLVAMQEYIKKYTKAPIDCIDSNVSSTVFVTFTIDTDGTIANMGTPDKTYYPMTERAVQLCTYMPRWEPGIRKGKKVRIYYMLPVRFHLTGPGRQADTASAFVLSLVDNMPMFPGGNNQIPIYIHEHTHKFMNMGIGRIVCVRFIINENGQVTDEKIVDASALLQNAANAPEWAQPLVTGSNASNPEFEKDALRMVHGMPDWRPGQIDGHKVSVYQSVAVIFGKDK